MIDNINDPQDGFPGLGKVEEAEPSGNWTLEELGQYAKRHEETAKRKMAIHTYRQGHALTLAFVKVEAEQGYGHWGAYLKQQGISTSSDDRARKLFRSVDNEGALEGLKITEAYEALGIEKPKTEKTAKGKPACRNSATKVDVDNAQEGHCGGQSPELDVPAESDIGSDDDREGDGDGHGDMLRAALKTVQKLSAGDHWNVLGQMVSILGLEWSDVAAWAARQATRAPVSAEEQVVDTEIVAGTKQIEDTEIVVITAPTLLVGGEADVSQGEDGPKQRKQGTPDQGTPAFLSVTRWGKPQEVSLWRGKWCFRRKGKWELCDKSFVRTIKKQLAVSAQEHSASATAEEQIADAEQIASAEIVVSPAPALLLGSEADVQQAAIDHHEEGFGDDIGQKPSKANPAKVTVGGRTCDVAWASGMWFFRAGNDWISVQQGVRAGHRGANGDGIHDPGRMMALAFLWSWLRKTVWPTLYIE